MLPEENIPEQKSQEERMLRQKSPVGENKPI
jgi:hypothetical protein